MMKQHLAGICFALFGLSAGIAHAEIQVWRLTATTSQVSAGFNVPAFASLGQTFSIDYWIDLSAPYDAQVSGAYKHAIRSIKVNGIVSEPTSNGYDISANYRNGINAINTVLPVNRADNLTYISYGENWPNPTHSLQETLNEMSRMHGAEPYLLPNYLYMAFGRDSINAVPSSFTLSPVPEPTSIAMMVAGLSALGLFARKRRKSKQLDEVVA